MWSPPGLGSSTHIPLLLFPHPLILVIQFDLVVRTLFIYFSSLFPTMFLSPFHSVCKLLHTAMTAPSFLPFLAESIPKLEEKHTHHQSKTSNCLEEEKHARKVSNLSSLREGFKFINRVVPQELSNRQPNLFFIINPF